MSGASSHLGHSEQKPIEAGRSIEDVCEAEAGSLVHHATLLSDLASEVYAVAEEWCYDEDEPAVELVRLCRELEAHLDRLSLTKAGALTLYRECRRCSGAGKTKREDPCVECGGRGHVHADEADG